MALFAVHLVPCGIGEVVAVELSVLDETLIRTRINDTWQAPMATTSAAVIPRNLTDSTRAIFRLGDEERVREESATADLASIPFEAAVPIRRFCAWQGKRNYEGEWWSSTTRTHIPFESLLERDALIALDFDPAVVGISAQPVALLWPHGTPDHRHHVPDFFARQRDGDGRLVDVKHPDRVEQSQPQFKLAREIAHDIGWHYEVFTGLPPAAQQNLRWLSGYRQDRHAPSEDLAGALVETFASKTSLQIGAVRIARAAGMARGRVLGHI